MPRENLISYHFPTTLSNVAYQIMSNDIKTQIINEIGNSRTFALQLDESTDVSLCAQVMIYVRYIHKNYFNNEFLFCYLN